MTDEYREKKILNFVPREVRTILDIGSRGEIFKKKYKTTTLDAVEDADVKQDLNKKQKISFSNKSFDLVVANQILEHLTSVEEIVFEIKRVSNKYIFIGLPNELVFSNRIRFLFGLPCGAGDGYYPYGHKHFFRINTIEKFILDQFGRYEKKDYVFIGNFSKFIPSSLKNFLAKKMPTLFAGQVNYLIKIKEGKK